MSNLIKQSNETQFDFIKRIVYGKLVDKTINEDWEELSELIFGEGNCYNSSEVRKRAYGILHILHEIENIKEENIIDTDILNELELKKIEIQKEKEKVRTLRIEFNKMIRKDARFELFLDEIKYSVNTIKSPVFKILENNNAGQRYGILGISDIHFGKIFQSVNNSYSMEIAKERLNILLNEVIEWVKDRKIDHLHIISCGDDVEGLLRISSIRVLEVGVIDSCILFAKMMSEWLNTLSQYVCITYYNTVSSNHTETRFLNVQAGSFPDEDLQKVIVNLIKESLKNNERILIPIYSENYILTKICGKVIYISHGHEFKSKPVKNIIKEINQLYNINVDICIIGHLHHEEIITVGENENGNVKVIVLPSIMGSDNYSNSLFAGAKSGATLIELNSNKKGIATSEVILN